MCLRLFAFSIGLLLLISMRAYATEPPLVPSITVSAQSRAEVDADVIEVTVSIGARAKDLEVLQKEIEARGQKLLFFARSFGLQEKDVVVLNTMTSRKYGKEDESIDVTSYDATRAFCFTLRDIPRYLEFVSGLMKNGAMLLLPPHMRSLQEKKYREQAYVDAMKMALEKASLLANAASARVGKAIAIEADDSDYDSLNYFYAGGAGANTGGSATNIKKVSIGAKVKVTYALQ